jgi:murein DD-endopeptidase MepM/ murein hydrolase activator NlpD
MRFKIFLTVVVFICGVNFCWAYPWPISNFSGPHPINATFGEFREPYGSLDYHFHYGVDIGSGVGTQVYPSSDGKVRRWSNLENGWIEVGDFRYVHINPNDLILDTARVCTTSVTLLGVVGAIYHPHLHFEEGIGIENKVNPLRVSGLDNYEDNANPSV